MNNIKHGEEVVDQDLVIQFVEELITEHKSDVIEHDQAIHAASITCKKLAQETARKFYYECIKYIMDLNE